MLLNTVLRVKNSDVNLISNSLLISRSLSTTSKFGNKSLLFKKLKQYDIQKCDLTQMAKLMQDLSKTNSLRRFNRSDYYQNEFHLLTGVYTKSGAIADMPKWNRFGIAKIVANLILFLILGSIISKKAVTILEENDIFKPEDDDDEDDD